MAEQDVKAWVNLQELPRQSGKRWTCGYCAQKVSSSRGYLGLFGCIVICPDCNKPTFFPSGGGDPMPGERYEQPISNLPPSIEKLYEEACRCMTIYGFTAVVMLCRALLLHVAKEKGIADTPRGAPSYHACVQYLVEKDWIGRKELDWVDEIRVFGNAANHELTGVNAEDAKKSLKFTTHLLTTIYHFREPAGT